MDDISLQFYCDGQTSKTYECAVNVGGLQLDNQMYSGDFYDFPVILAKENPAKNVQSALNVLCKLNPVTFAPENVHISLAPVACFVEDTLAFHLLKLVDTYLAPALLVIPKGPKDPTEGNKVHSKQNCRVELKLLINFYLYRVGNCLDFYFRCGCHIKEVGNDCRSRTHPYRTCRCVPLCPRISEDVRSVRQDLIILQRNRAK